MSIAICGVQIAVVGAANEGDSSAVGRPRDRCGVASKEQLPISADHTDGVRPSLPAQRVKAIVRPSGDMDTGRSGATTGGSARTPVTPRGHERLPGVDGEVAAPAPPPCDPGQPAVDDRPAWVRSPLCISRGRASQMRTANPDTGCADLHVILRHEFPPSQHALPKRERGEHHHHENHKDEPEPGGSRAPSALPAWFQEPHVRSEPVIKCYSVQSLGESPLSTRRFAVRLPPEV
jgi:hypothetical protein